MCDKCNECHGSLGRSPDPTGRYRESGEPSKEKVTFHLRLKRWIENFQKKFGGWGGTVSLRGMRNPSWGAGDRSWGLRETCSYLHLRKATLTDRGEWAKIVGRLFSNFKTRGVDQGGGSGYVRGKGLGDWWRKVLIWDGSHFTHVSGV